MRQAAITDAGSSRAAHKGPRKWGYAPAGSKMDNEGEHCTRLASNVPSLRRAGGDALPMPQHGASLTCTGLSIFPWTFWTRLRTLFTDELAELGLCIDLGRFTATCRC